MRPTVRGGGVAVAVAAMVGIALVSPMTGHGRVALIVAAGGFGLLGLAEDIHGAPAVVRLELQVLVAVAALPLLLGDLTGPWPWRLFFAAGVVVWLVSCVNAVNFMDGIDGISAAQALVAGVAWWAIGRAEHVPVLAAGGLVVAAAAAGFAPFNAPRARMFLGDVGSYFIGGWLATLVVLGLRGGLTFEAAVAPLALYLADTASTIVRRIRRGDVWHEAHREHAYQRLVQGGWSHMRVTLFAGGFMAVCSGLGAATLAGPRARVAADALLSVTLAGYLLSPALAHRRSAAPGCLKLPAS